MHYHLPGPKQIHWRPLPKTVFEGKSKATDLTGIYAKEELGIGQVIGITHAEIRDAELGSIMVRSQMGSTINHNVVANCYRFAIPRPWGDLWVLRAGRDIPVNEHLTLVYKDYNPTLPSVTDPDMEEYEINWLESQVLWVERTVGV